MPQVNRAGRYPIGEAAKLLGINRTTLARWIDTGRAKCSYTRITKRRIFTGEQILKIWNYNA